MSRASVIKAKPLGILGIPFSPRANSTILVGVQQLPGILGWLYEYQRVCCLCSIAGGKPVSHRQSEGEGPLPKEE
jgi:hypothetical protein